MLLLTLWLTIYYVNVIYCYKRRDREASRSKTQANTRHKVKLRLTSFIYIANTRRIAWVLLLGASLCHSAFTWIYWLHGVLAGSSCVCLCLLARLSAGPYFRYLARLYDCLCACLFVYSRSSTYMQQTTSMSVGRSVRVAVSRCMSFEALICALNRFLTVRLRGHLFMPWCLYTYVVLRISLSLFIGQRSCLTVCLTSCFPYVVTFAT